jgi:hypothetical protein
MDSKLELKANTGFKGYYDVLKNDKRVCSVLLGSQSSNCKLSTAEYLPSVIFSNSLNKEEKIEVINIILRISRLLLFTHINSKEAYEFLKDNFDVSYCIEVPIGYSESFQYHIGIANSTHDGYKNYFKNRKAKSSSVLYLRNETIKASNEAIKHNLNNEAKKLLLKEIISIEKDGLKTTKGIINRLKRKINL